MGCSESTRARGENNIESSKTESTDKDENIAQALSLYNKDLSQLHTRAQEIGDFSCLLDLLEDDSPFSGLRACPRWAEIPNTTACVAISLLNRSLKLQKRSISEEKLLSSSETILGLFLDDNHSLTQHAAYFVYKLCHNGYTSFKKELITSNIFQNLNKFLIHPNLKFRYLALKLCAILYKDNSEAKRLFCENGGVKNMIWQIYFCPMACLQFHKLLAFLKLLMTDQGNIDQTFAIIVAKEVGNNFFTQFDVTKLSGKNNDAFDEIINILIQTRRDFNISDNSE